MDADHPFALFCTQDRLRKGAFRLLFTVPLKQNHVFRKLYARGRSAVGAFVVVYCMRNGTKENQLGVTASTKLGHAVVRNRARRRLREVYRLHESELRPGFDVILVARSRCLTADFKKLEAAFLKQCAELKLLRRDA